MIQVRKAADRGHFDHGWLDTYHTLAFGDYYDPEQMGFRSLRVMNEDRVLPGQGFGMHGHRDMEIVTYVLEGAIEHRDSLGNGSILRAGELQQMTAGTGVRHSEFNPSRAESVHLYQIWLLPERRGLLPRYDQKAFNEKGREGAFQLVASPDGANGSLRIHQDARIFLSTLRDGATIAQALSPGRHAWLQVLKGKVAVNGQPLSTSDGAAIGNEERLDIRSDGAAEIMLFDLE